MSDKIHSMRELKRRNAQQGGHWFEAGAMRFFSSRIHERLYHRDGTPVIYFVTSERYSDRSPRLYSVRAFDVADCTIETVGEFQAYKTSRAAHATAARLVQSRFDSAEVRP